MANKKGWAWDQAVHLPRTQYRATGKQEGTQPKRLKGKRMPMTNLNDKMRQWQDAYDSGGHTEVRTALRETLAQFRHHLENPAGAPEVPDLTAKHYLEVCAQVDAIRGSIEESEKAGRKRIDLSVLKEILGDKA